MRNAANFKQHVEEVGAVFVPFVLETSGALGKEASKFLQLLSEWAIENSISINPFLLNKELRHAIACILHRGNGLIMHGGRGKSLKRAYWNQ